MPDFHVQRFICAAWVYSLPFSREILYIEKLMAANHSPKVLLKMSSRHGLWLTRRRLMSSTLLTFVLAR